MGPTWGLAMPTSIAKASTVGPGRALVLTSARTNNRAMVCTSSAPATTGSGPRRSTRRPRMGAPMAEPIPTAATVKPPRVNPRPEPVTTISRPSCRVEAGSRPMAAAVMNRQPPVPSRLTRAWSAPGLLVPEVAAGVVAAGVVAAVVASACAEAGRCAAGCGWVMGSGSGGDVNCAASPTPSGNHPSRQRHRRRSGGPYAS